MHRKISDVQFRSIKMRSYLMNVSMAKVQIVSIGYAFDKVGKRIDLFLTLISRKKISPELPDRKLH